MKCERERVYQKQEDPCIDEIMKIACLLRRGLLQHHHQHCCSVKPLLLYLLLQEALWCQNHTKSILLYYYLFIRCSSSSSQIAWNCGGWMEFVGSTMAANYLEGVGSESRPRGHKAWRSRGSKVRLGQTKTGKLVHVVLLLFSHTHRVVTLYKVL